jgi:hypothetical protein
MHFINACNNYLSHSLEDILDGMSRLEVWNLKLIYRSTIRCWIFPTRPILLGVLPDITKP